MRRMMLNKQEANNFLTFENTENSIITSRYGNYYGYVTISDGNHIKITSAGGTEWFFDINVSSAATNGTSASNVTDTWFVIPAGATVKFCLKNVSLKKDGVSQMRMALGADESIHDILRFVNGGIVEANERTITVDSDTAVPCLTCSVLTYANALAEIEFDFELYINGKRCI